MNYLFLLRKPTAIGVSQFTAIGVWFFVVSFAAGFPNGAVQAEGIPEQQEWLDRVNAQLSKFSRLEGCEFPQTSEYQISRERMQERASSPLTPMERQFAIPKFEDKSNFEVYQALIAGGFIENNAEPSQIKGQFLPTFSLTMKGWKAFPLNRGGQQTCIHWVVHDQAKVIFKNHALPNGTREITYERDMCVVPNWLSPSMRARYNKHGYALIPESTGKQDMHLFSKQLAELSKHAPEQIRSRFPSDSKEIEMAQTLLDKRLQYGKEPCVPLGNGYITSKDLWSRSPNSLPIYYFASSIDFKHLQMLRAFVREGYMLEVALDAPLQTPNGLAKYAFQLTSKYLSQFETNEHKTCLRYGRAIAKEVVGTPDGHPGYIQYFVVWYEITDLQDWINLPGVLENLPESVRLCIKSGSLLQVDAISPGNGGGPGCSLSWF